MTALPVTAGETKRTTTTPLPTASSRALRASDDAPVSGASSYRLSAQQVDQALQPPGTLLVMAGGTGGHVFPGLAVAHRMAAAGWRVVWLGSPNGMEATLVPKHGVPIEFVRFGGVRGKGLRTKLLAPFKLLRAIGDAAGVLRRVRPDVVLGMGGYITFPAGLVAAMQRLPLVLHEQNSIAGMANRMLAKLARRTLVAFPNALPGGEWTGNPVRADVVDVAAPTARFEGRVGPLRLLVVGGSLGAAALNETVPRAVARLPLADRPHIVHQAGAKHLDALRKHYADAGLPGTGIELVPFIDDMAQAYAQADVVICRSGAMTVSEIAAIGVAALFVPFPFAVDDHQTTNGQFLSEQGAAVMIQQRDLTVDGLAEWLAGLTRETLLEMACKARALARPDATAQVAIACAEAARPRRAGGLKLDETSKQEHGVDADRSPSGARGDDAGSRS
jgi:UDP-N-acetylglucosamine--N-acetylmuramyl-(pentapeptide) pyrophosphoryl-undecaprenol N-acetylglucosamine transferase